MDLEVPEHTSEAAFTNTVSASPGRLLGPRQPTIKRERSIAPAGTSKSTRVVSGAGRRVSTGRETIPLKNSPTITDVSHASPLLNKRTRSDEALAPRKMSFNRHTMPKAFDSEVDLGTDASSRALPESLQGVSESGVFLPQMMLIEPTPLEPKSDVFWDPDSSNQVCRSDPKCIMRCVRANFGFEWFFFSLPRESPQLFDSSRPSSKGWTPRSEKR